MNQISTLKCENCKIEDRVIGDFCYYCWHILDAHYCYEWDGLLIDKTHPEYQSCTCSNKTG